MDKARKKYVNVEQLSNGEILAMLDRIDNHDEDKVDNLINDLDIGFASNEPLVSESSNSNSGHPVLVPETSVHVTNVENTPDGDKQSCEKEKTGIKKKTDEPWKWKNQSKKLDKVEFATEAEVLVDLNFQSAPSEIF